MSHVCTCGDCSPDWAEADAHNATIHALAEARAEAERQKHLLEVERLNYERAEVNRAAEHAEVERLRGVLRRIGENGGPLYLLEPSQGERPDPGRAAGMLRDLLIEGRTDEAGT